MQLCERVMANCFVNESYSAVRNGTCPKKVEQFVVGFAFENQGGGRNDSTAAAAASCPTPQTRVPCTYCYPPHTEVSGGCNARTPVSFPFPTYMSTEAFLAKMAIVGSSMDALFNFIL